MWNMGHGRGHENDQGMAHMEAVGSMNGTTLRMTVHESSIRLQTMEGSNAVREESWGLHHRPSEKYINRVKLTVRP